jgi:hypothetical protein
MPGTRAKGKHPQSGRTVHLGLIALDPLSADQPFAQQNNPYLLIATGVRAPVTRPLYQLE